MGLGGFRAMRSFGWREAVLCRPTAGLQIAQGGADDGDHLWPTCGVAAHERLFEIIQNPVGGSRMGEALLRGEIDRDQLGQPPYDFAVIDTGPQSTALLVERIEEVRSLVEVLRHDGLSRGIRGAPLLKDQEECPSLAEQVGLFEILSVAVGNGRLLPALGDPVHDVAEAPTNRVLADLNPAGELPLLFQTQNMLMGETDQHLEFVLVDQAVGIVFVDTGHK